MIYHPALSYFARDYGLHQILSKKEEKNPLLLIEGINRSMSGQKNVQVIFVQPEFDKRNAETIAQQTGNEKLSPSIR